MSSLFHIEFCIVCWTSRLGFLATARTLRLLTNGSTERRSTREHNYTSRYCDTSGMGEHRPCLLLLGKVNLGGVELTDDLAFVPSSPTYRGLIPDGAPSTAATLPRRDGHHALSSQT